MNNRCQQCGNPSAEAWCETCCKDIMVILLRSMDERKVETFRERMARKERYLRARVERSVRYE